MFQYKVFRARFLRTTTAVLLAVSMLFGAAYAFFSRSWVNEAQSAANEMFRGAENALRGVDRLVDQQLGRVYEDDELVIDLRVFTQSWSEFEYLDGRRRNSSSTMRLIRSLPVDVRIYLWWHAPSLVQVEVYGGDHVNWIAMHSEAPLLRFDMRGVDGQPAYASQDLFYVKRSVYDPNGAYARIGDVAFGFDIADTLEDVVNPSCRMAAIIDAQDRPMFLVGGSDADRALLARVREADDMGGNLRDGAFNRAYYTVYESGSYGYRLVVCTDDATAIRNNMGVLAILALLVALLGAIFLSVAYTNLRTEAAFLGRILDVIASVKRGDYRTPPKLRGRQRDDEYGLIARELDAMSRELHRQIVRGYQLAIRQRDAEMKALQATINPHFLYNTLEAIRSRMLVEGDRDTADAVANLGALYRDIVKRKDVIALGEEVQILEKYLRITSFRYPDTFVYQIDVEDERLRGLPTVKFWMQPIAENFLKHGFRLDGSLNLLIVQARAVPGGTRIEIRDNGTGIPPDRLEAVREAMRDETAASDHVGLRNVYVRLMRFYGETFQMDVDNNPEGGACVWAFLPEEVETCIRS